VGGKKKENGNKNPTVGGGKRKGPLEKILFNRVQARRPNNEEKGKIKKGRMAKGDKLAGKASWLHRGGTVKKEGKGNRMIHATGKGGKV